jgi:hypothetical protein
MKERAGTPFRMFFSKERQLERLSGTFSSWHRYN